MEINLNEKRKKGRPKKNIHITLNINSKDNISGQNVIVDNNPDIRHDDRACTRQDDGGCTRQDDGSCTRQDDGTCTRHDNSIKESSNSDNKVVLQLNESDNVKNVNETVEIKKKRGRKKKRL